MRVHVSHQRQLRNIWIYNYMIIVMENIEQYKIVFLSQICVIYTIACWLMVKVLSSEISNFDG